MYKNQQKQKIVQTFMNHCALVIQANFKGYSQRKYYKRFLPIYRRFKQLLYAGYLGWKTRKIFKLSNTKAKILQISILKTQQKNMQVRIAKRDFLDEVSRLLKNGMWMYYYLKQKKTPLSQRIYSVDNKKQQESKKTNLKHVLNIIPKFSQKKEVSKGENKQTIQIKLKQPPNIKSKQKQIQINVNQRITKNVKKTRKFQIPSKQSLIQKRQKQVELEIQTIQQPIIQQLDQFSNCQTPNGQINREQTYSFATKPRYSNPLYNQLKLMNQKEQQSFKQTHVTSYSSRKGLNMTLSKKFTLKNQQQISQLNEKILHGFTKMKKHEKQIKILSETNVSHNIKDVSAFGQTQQFQCIDPVDIKIIKPAQTQRNISIKIRKDQFEIKKLQFQKKSKHFKNIIIS